MNSTYHWTQRARLTPYPKTNELFRVGITYKDVAMEQVFFRVHVPRQLQPALLALDAPLGLHLLSLEINGKASRSLPNAPEHVIVGVTLHDGRRVWHCPTPWVQLRRRTLALAATGSLLGLALAPLAAQSGSIAVAALSATATLALSQAMHILDAIRFRPFATLGEVSGPMT